MAGKKEPRIVPSKISCGEMDPAPWAKSTKKNNLHKSFKGIGKGCSEEHYLLGEKLGEEILYIGAKL